MELSAPEFLRRFLLHVVPPGFMRIRHFGLLANRTRQEKLTRCRQLLAVAATLRQYAAGGAGGELHVGIGLNAAGDILIDNLDPGDVYDCTITLSGGFSRHTSRLPAGDRLMLPAESFKRDDGVKYRPSLGKPEKINVTCMKPERRTAELGLGSPR
jgi:hypothetical protein